MQRNFEPMQKQVEAWQKCELTDITAKVVIYEAFVEGKLEAPNTWRGLYTTCTSYVAYRFMWPSLLGRVTRAVQSRQVAT
jgi:hypothetical protein